MNNIQTAIQNYLDERGFARFRLKAVLFDMDGVLYDSMPNHARAWTKAMNAHGLRITETEAYMHEGRTGADTINILCRRQGVRLSEEEISALYHEKTLAFNACPEVRPMPGSFELLRKVVGGGLRPMLVTGSGQPSLLGRLNRDFPGVFLRENMVTSFDVKRGKPHPEPYLTALAKGGLEPNEAIVVENAPLGVEAAHAAHLFTAAANTGPLPDAALTSSGANLLYPSIKALCDDWDNLERILTNQ